LNGPFRSLNHVLAWPCIGVIRLYQWTLSPFVGGQCRFYPTCSHYGVDAYRLHGVWRGTWLTLRRIGRCRPFGGSGYDPVPIPDSGPSDPNWTPPRMEQRDGCTATNVGPR